MPPSDHFELRQRPTRHGYQLMYRKAGPHPARTVLTSDAKHPLTWIAQDGRYFQIMDPALAQEESRIVARR